jgi:hypothetical protein
MSCLSVHLRPSIRAVGRVCLPTANSRITTRLPSRSITTAVSLASPFQMPDVMPKHNNNNNSIQFFITYVLSQEPQGQLQTQLSVHKSIYIWTNTT